MPNSSDLSLYDTYFYGPMVVAALIKYGPAVDATLKSSRGTTWQSEFNAAVDTYRAAVDGSIRETEEANAATKAMQEVQDRINPWRRVMEGFARSAPPAQQRLLMRAAGFGLGTPRSVKEGKDFLLNVAPLVEINKAAFAQLGADADLLSFPATARNALEGGAQTVAKEKGEATVARANVQMERAKLGTWLRAVENASEMAVQLGVFKKDETARKAAEALEAQLHAALNEARVQARTRAAEAPVPPELVAPPAVEPADQG